MRPLIMDSDVFLLETSVLGDIMLAQSHLQAHGQLHKAQGRNSLPWGA
jgi:hypothetical protein